MHFETIRTFKINKLKASADYWQFYNIKGRDEAAQRLNIAIMNSVVNKEFKTRTELINTIEKELIKESKFGATDSEGYEVVLEIADKLWKGERG